MASINSIFMLEDELERLDRFSRVLSDANIELIHFRTAQNFISAYQALEDSPELICLDHDLFVDHPDDPDPGDGRDVARFLATVRPSGHVIIHSSNSPAADSMLFTLNEAGWSVEKIAPLGHDWIETYWWPVVRDWMGQ